MSTLSIFIISLTFLIAHSYNNGIGKRPLMGWTTWYAYESKATEDDIKQNIQSLISRGFQKAGYISINLNEGWILNRSINGSIISDPIKYPSGMIALGEYIHNHSFRYGLYTSRGKSQCDDESGTYHAPGSDGYYNIDAQYFANAGADYLKFDSCAAPQDINNTINEYTNMSNILNTTGRSIYYDLCGWHWYLGIYGQKIANSWRMVPDPNAWNTVQNAMEIFISGMWKYAGPYGWNNGGELYAENKNSGLKWGHQTSLQARAQFSFYAAASSDMVISNNIADLSDYDIETYLNMDMIAVSQDLGPDDGPHAGYKIWGVTAINDTFVYGKKLSDGSFVAVFMNTIDGIGTVRNITCDEGCFLGMGFNESVIRLNIKDLWSGKSLGVVDAITDYGSEMFTGVLEMQVCTGDESQIFEYNASDGTISSSMGMIGVYNCRMNETLPAIVSTKMIDIDNGCDGNNFKWNVTETNNIVDDLDLDYSIVNICNRNYMDNGMDGCLFVDSIGGNKYGYIFWEDGTIRELESCQSADNIPVYNSNCRCLGIRPYIGQYSFVYTVENVQPQGGVRVLQFAPV